MMYLAHEAWINHAKIDDNVPPCPSSPCMERKMNFHPNFLMAFQFWTTFFYLVDIVNIKSIYRVLLKKYRRKLEIFAYLF